MKTTLALLTLAVAAACGSSGAPSIPDAAAPDDTASATDNGGPIKGVTDAPNVACGCDHATSLCAKLDTCAPFLMKAIYGDAVGCADRLTKSCSEQCRSRGTGMTETAILACESALSGASCNEVFANALAECAVSGTLTDGTACGDNSQCTSGFCAHRGALCGTCAAKGSAGAACPSGSNDECKTGLVCSGGKVCAAPAALGAPCDDTTAPCLTGTFCTSSKTCASTVAAGADCPGAFLNLVDGAVCFGKGTAANPQTAKQLETTPVGQACGLAPGDNAGPTLCAPGGVAACTAVSGAAALFGLPTKGICAGEKRDGYACSAGDLCQAGAQCINGICQIPSGRYCD